MRGGQKKEKRLLQEVDEVGGVEKKKRITGGRGSPPCLPGGLIRQRGERVK